MCKPGDDWQARLEGQFRSLADRRAGGRTVFALEHGLTVDEVDELRKTVASTFHSRSERARHWLPMVVHAAEVAYEYDGDEFWQSFDGVTPGWDSTQTSRQDVRQAFQRFAAEYRGPTPHGRWADWFTIICWPIANAILPTDLQRQLARALYIAGPGLGQRIDNIDELGRYVAASAWEGSDRFQQLREQPTFLGQIAFALLRPQSTTDTMLLESTLRRIVSDLESERSAAGWIRSARGALAKPVLRMAGTRIGVDRGGSQQLEAKVEQVARLTSPEVLLRYESQTSTWGVWLRLPNLSPLAALSPEVRQALVESNCSAPAADVPIARGRLLFDAQEIRLVRWPKADAPLVRFQGLASGLESALLRAWAGPDMPAVFRVRSDGTAHRVVSRSVRAGLTYLLAHESPPDALRQLANETRCSGVHINRVEVPSVIEPRMAQALRGIGCLPTQSAAVWPVGAIPVAWDGEGTVEWLTSDSPMLGVATDHELLELSFEITGAQREATGRIGAGETTFVVLPELPVGTHELLVREVPTEGAPTTRRLVVGIREPVRSIGAGPNRMWAEPHSTDLGQLWSGLTAICVAGPARRTDLSFTLSPRPGGPASATIRLAATIPLTSTDWRTLIEQRVHDDDEVVDAFDSARWGRIEIDAGRFGVHALEFERALPPLRWALADTNGGYMLTLHDDGEGINPPEVSFATFGRPDLPNPVGDGPQTDAFRAEAGGGLYVAKRGADYASIVAPPRQRVFRSLDELRNDVRLSPPPNDPGGLVRQFQLVRLWSRATLPGHPLARAWRADAIGSLQTSLITVMCGIRWGESERIALERRSAASLRALEAGFASPSPMTRSHVDAIALQSQEMSALSQERKIEAFRPLMSSANQFGGRAWVPIVTRRGPHATDWAAEFYLRLATDPEVDLWAGSSMAEGIGLAIAWPLPLRVARYLALAAIVGSTSGPATFPPLFPGWSWR